MPSLPTLPRRSGLERISIGLAGVLALIGAIGLGGWWMKIDALLLPGANLTPIRAEEALCFFVIGLVLLLREMGFRWAGWLAAVPAALGLLILGASFFNRDLRLGSLLVNGQLFDLAGTSSRVAAMAACCLSVGAIVLV